MTPSDFRVPLSAYAPIILLAVLASFFPFFMPALVAVGFMVVTNALVFGFRFLARELGQDEDAAADAG